MRKVASYSFHSSLADEVDAELSAGAVAGAIDTWLKKKGEEIDNGFILVLKEDGKHAKLIRTRVESAIGKISEVSITQTTSAGTFQTIVSVAQAGSELLFYCELRAAGEANQVGPLHIDVHCPQVVRDVVSLEIPWHVGATPIPAKTVRFRGEEGGRRLGEVIWHSDRNLPVVVVSQLQGQALTPDTASSLSWDLSGLAIVVQIDESASWTLTGIHGREWSCFGGSIRLYWPGLNLLDADPMKHPLWSRYSLLQDDVEPAEAAQQLRRQLRRRILGISAFSVHEPDVFRKIRAEARKEESEIQRNKVSQNGQWEGYALEMASANDGLRLKVEELEESISSLRTQLTYAQEALQWHKPIQGEVAPQGEPPPDTVEAAVATAKHRLAADVAFGSDVDLAARELAPDAGPPEKLLAYLDALAEMARVRRTGTLGTTAIDWLKKRNLKASGESETIRNSPAEMRRRKWNDGVSERVFEDHMKPSDGVSPDRCVRIYFDYDEKRGQVVVGYIGRHLD